MVGNPEYKLVGQIISGGDLDGNYSTEATEVYGCLRCGALVFDQDKHNRSHATSSIGFGI